MARAGNEKRRLDHGVVIVGLHASPAQVMLKQGGTDMADKGRKDKGKREQQKKAHLSPKEKRKLKREKKAR